MNKEQSFLYGIHPILEKVRARPDDVLEVIIAEGAAGKATQDLYALAKHCGIPVAYHPRATLDRLAHGQRHQGAIARVKPYEYREISELLAEVGAQEWAGCVMVLDSLTDPHNFGAILRTAEAAGVHHIVIPKDRSVGVTPTVVKASAGAVHHLKIYQVTNLRRVLESFKEHGLWVVGLSPDGTDAVFDRAYPPRLCLVLGSEGEGIRPLIRRQCDFEVAIPMAGRTASLNVSVAAAVFLYELVRQGGNRNLKEFSAKPNSSQ